MAEKKWAGIDPGASGALCILAEDNTIEFFDYSKSKISGYASSNITKCLIIGLEKVSSMPGQGVKSMFSFGQRLGELEGMLQALKLSYATPRPQEWQRFCGVVAKTGKQGTYDVISKLYPHAELTGSKGGILDGRVDALGIAHFIRYKHS